MSTVLVTISMIFVSLQLPGLGDDAIPPYLKAPKVVPQLSRSDGEKLRSLAALIDQQSVFLSLVDLDEIEFLESPWAIVTLTDLLKKDVHRWLALKILRALDRRSAADLIQFGGERLHRRLLQFKNDPHRAIVQRAYSIRTRIEKQLAAAGAPDSGFPPSLRLPSDLASSGKTSVVTGNKGRGGDTAAALAIEKLGKGIDLVCAIDATGSMHPYLPNCIESVTKLQQILAPLLGEVRWGCVVYRDRVEGVSPLSNNWNRLKYSLEMLQAKGGQAPNERVDLALAAAFSSRMGWSRDRVGAVIFFADAAPLQVHSRALGRATSRLFSKWPHLRVHAVCFGHATGVGPTAEFWRMLTEACGGRCLEHQPTTRMDLQLLRPILISFFPEQERQQIDRIVSVIAAVER